MQNADVKPSTETFTCSLPTKMFLVGILCVYTGMSVFVLSVQNSHSMNNMLLSGFLTVLVWGLLFRVIIHAATVRITMDKTKIGVASKIRQLREIHFDDIKSVCHTSYKGNTITSIHFINEKQKPITIPTGNLKAKDAEKIRERLKDKECDASSVSARDFSIMACGYTLMLYLGAVTLAVVFILWK